MNGRNRFLGVGRLFAVWLAIVLLLRHSQPDGMALAIGLPWVILGEAVRFWAAGYLKKSVELAIDGPYRFTRNPLYLGRLSILTGLFLISPLAWGLHWILLLVGWAIFFGYYLPRKERVEPQRLEAIHGEAYRRYRKTVPALWPTLRPYPAGSARWSVQRLIANREHWMVAGLAVYVAIQLYRVFGG